MSSKEQRAKEREETENIMSSFKMNLDDTVNKIKEVQAMTKMGMSPQQAVSAGRDQFIDKDNNIVGGKVVGPANHHMDWNSLVSKYNPNLAQKLAQSGQNDKMPLQYAQQNTISIATLTNKMEKNYEPIINAIGNFKFASDDKRRDGQMQEIVDAIRVAVRKLAIKEVARNSRNFYSNMDKFSYTDNGVKGIFSVANVKVAVSADGEFQGNEILCLEQDGNNITGYVARQNGDKFEDVTNNYAMKLEVLKT